ncbi:MAG: hypothetical protein PF484_05470 [Bacteroidales bacterium]|jgi:hypothetical protein|nr:hypothetical protein [Bacteroidales bacterium]
MNLDDIHIFGLRFMYRELTNNGFEVLSVEPDLETYPQIVARKSNQLYFIVVQTAAYPDIGDLPTNHQIKLIQEHAQKHNAITKFTSIGLANANAKNEMEKSILKKGDEFLVNYSGIKELIRL